MPQKVGRAGDKWASLTPVHLYIIHYRYIQPQLESWTLRSTVPGPMIIKQYSTKQFFFFYLTERTFMLCFIRAVIKEAGAGDFPRLLRAWPPATFVGK